MLFLVLARSGAGSVTVKRRPPARSAGGSARDPITGRGANVVLAGVDADRIGLDFVALVDAADDDDAREILHALPHVAGERVEMQLVPISLDSAEPRRLGREEAIVEQAVGWALRHVGSRDYAGRCLAFVEDAYERPNRIEVFGGDSARASAELYAAARSGAGPERGSFVFFDTHGVVDGELRDWGHVGLALGDGRMVHAWPTVRVDTIEALGALPSGGWSTPVLVGWTAPQRILADARTAQAASAREAER